MMYGILDCDNCYCSCEKVFRPDLEGQPIECFIYLDGMEHLDLKKWGEGYQYKKAGVIVMGITPDSPIQQDLFDLNAEQIQKMRRLDEVIDRINRLHGSETIVIGAQQYTQKNGKGKAEVFANAIKHDFRSKNPTTRWADIIKLR